VLAGGTLVLHGGGLAVSGVVASGGLAIVSGGAVASNTIESGGTEIVTAGGEISNAQTIDGGSLVIDAGATLNVGGGVVFTSAADGYLSLGQSLGGAFIAVSGFAVGDTIDLSTLAYSGTTTATLDGSTLAVTEGAVTETVAFNPYVAAPAGPFVLTPDGNGGTDITMACFAEGTRIATARGEVAVERLRQGDSVVTHAGGSQPVVWLGHRHIDCRRHPRPDKVWPVRVQKNALGAGLPAHDLLLSPDHALFIDGALIPVHLLINGDSIVQERRDEITYWHVELPAHDVLLAERLPCESFLDTGNRSAFANGGVLVRMHADFAARAWDADSCAPLLLSGPKVAAQQARLRKRAARPARRRLAPTS